MDRAVVLRRPVGRVAVGLAATLAALFALVGSAAASPYTSSNCGVSYTGTATASDGNQATVILQVPPDELVAGMLVFSDSNGNVLTAAFGQITSSVCGYNPAWGGAPGVPNVARVSGQGDLIKEPLGGTQTVDFYVELALVNGGLGPNHITVYAFPPGQLGNYSASLYSFHSSSATGPGTILPG